MNTRTPCGHRPTRKAEFIGMLPDGSAWTLCGRRACEDQYNYGAIEFSNAEGCRGAIEIPAPKVESPAQPEAGPVNTGLAPTPSQSRLFEVNA